MGQDLTLGLQSHTCADTAQPLALCRCFSPFLLPSFIAATINMEKMRDLQSCKHLALGYGVPDFILQLALQAFAF